MIRSFGDRDTERLWWREPVRSYDSRILRTALRKLAILDAVGQHSIRINDQWRICFTWTPNGPENVTIEDYH